MAWRRLMAFTAVALGACATPEVAAPSLPQALRGVWCNSNDGGQSCWAWDEFTEQGTLELCGLQEEDHRPFKATAAVNFTGQRMCYRVLEATANFWLQPGERYCTEIVEVHPQRHVYRDLDSGRHFELLRKPASQRQCPPLR